MMNKYTYRICLPVPVDVAVWATDMQSAMEAVKPVCNDIIPAGAAASIMLVGVEIVAAPAAVN